MKLILVDDRPTNRKLLAQLAQTIDSSLEITSFESAPLALEWCKTHTPDLVISDYNMPEMNGAEFIIEFRKVEKHLNVPIIVLTAHEDKDYRLNALNAGATDFLQRPIDHQEFQVRVRNLLTLRRQHLLLEKQSEQKLKAFLDSIPAIVCATDEEGQVSFANKYMLDLLDVEQAQCFGKPVEVVFEQRGFSRSFAQQFNEVLNRPFEETITDPAGQERVFLTTRVTLSEVHPSKDEVMVAIDITQRKKAERNFKQQGHYFRRVIDSSPNLIFSHNPDGLITMVNAAFAHACGVPQDDLIGMSIYNVKFKFGKPQNKKVQELDHPEGRSKVILFTQSASLPNGEPRWFQTVQTTLKSALTQKPETLNVMSDITVLIRQAEELSKAKEEAEAANWSKTEFLANMSHELRTPLNAIINFSEIMRREILGPVGNEKYLEYSKDINDSGAHLLTIINDILDIAKIESGQMMIKFDTVDVCDLVDSVARLLKHRVEAASLTLDLDLPREHAKIMGDPVKLKQVLFNLITNSIKFTPMEGCITVGVTLQNEGVEFYVKDTGIGIKPEDIDKALRRFGQLESHLTKQHSGSGLGLSIAKSFVELHNGVFTLESEVGVGTMARFYVPYKQAASPKEAVKKTIEYMEPPEEAKVVNFPVRH